MYMNELPHIQTTPPPFIKAHASPNTSLFVDSTALIHSQQITHKTTAAHLANKFSYHFPYSKTRRQYTGTEPGLGTDTTS
jgi:hypothetical protein